MSGKGKDSEVCRLELNSTASHSGSRQPERTQFCAQICLPRPPAPSTPQTPMLDARGTQTSSFTFTTTCDLHRTLPSDAFYE